MHDGHVEQQAVPAESIGVEERIRVAVAVIAQTRAERDAYDTAGEIGIGQEHPGQGGDFQVVRPFSMKINQSSTVRSGAAVCSSASDSAIVPCISKLRASMTWYTRPVTVMPMTRAPMNAGSQLLVPRAAQIAAPPKYNTHKAKLTNV